MFTRVIVADDEYPIIFPLTTRLVIVAPVETVKTKVIELNKPFIEGLKHILKNEGLGGVYQGVGL